MSGLIKIFVLMLMLSAVSFAQWTSSKVLFPETADSKPFKVPNNYMYFSGLVFPDTLGTDIGDADHDVVYFLVSNDTLGQGWDTLSYDDAVYTVNFTSKAITLKPFATYPFQWWKIYFENAIADSVYFYPQFTK
jgi:hypothetical protein